MARKIAEHLVEAKLSQEEAVKKAELAEKQAEALKALQEALITVVENEEDPQLKEGLTIQTKRQLMEILSPVKEENCDSKKPKLEAVAGAAGPAISTKMEDFKTEVSVSAMGAPVIMRNTNIRGMDRQVKKETEKERKLRLVAADMKPLSEYWSKGKMKC